MSIDPKTVGQQTSQTVYPFLLLDSEGVTLSQYKISINQKISWSMRPALDVNNYVYGYSAALTDPVYYLPGSAKVNNVYFRGVWSKLVALPSGSSGGNYVSQSGTVVALPVGSAIPDGWVQYIPGTYTFVSGTKIKQVKVGDKQDINGYYPANDGNYQISALSVSGMSTDVFVVTKGQQVTGVNVCYLIGYTPPTEPPPAVPVNPTSSDLGIAPDPTASDPYSNAPAIPEDYVGPVSKPDPYAPMGPTGSDSAASGGLLLASKIIAVVGLAGIGYVGYLIVTNPEGAKVFLSRFAELKELIVDSAQLLVSFGVIAAIGFISYEFILAYEKAGDVPGAIASLTASTIETFITVLVTVIEDLVVDLGKWIGDEVSKIADAIKHIFV